MTTNKISDLFINPATYRPTKKVIALGVAGIVLGVASAAIGGLALASVLHQLPSSLSILSPVGTIGMKGAYAMMGAGGGLALGSIAALILTHYLGSRRKKLAPALIDKAFSLFQPNNTSSSISPLISDLLNLQIMPTSAPTTPSNPNSSVDAKLQSSTLVPNLSTPPSSPIHENENTTTIEQQTDQPLLTENLTHTTGHLEHSQSTKDSSNSSNKFGLLGYVALTVMHNLQQQGQPPLSSNPASEENHTKQPDQTQVPTPQNPVSNMATMYSLLFQKK